MKTKRQLCQKNLFSCTLPRATSSCAALGKTWPAGEIHYSLSKRLLKSRKLQEQGALRHSEWDEQDAQPGWRHLRAPNRAYGRHLSGVYLQQATALVLKHMFMLLSTACSPWSSVTRSRFCWRQHLPVTLCFMHRWLFTIPGVISLPRSSTGRRPPPCPLLFSFKTKQKPKQGIQRMFFLPTKEISGASSIPLVSALGLAAMCSISHRLSPVTGKCAPTSRAAAGEQLGWAVLGWDSEPEQRAKEGFCISGGIFLDAYRRWTSWLCVPFPARKQLMGRAVAPTPCTPEQSGFGHKSSPQSVLWWDKASLYQVWWLGLWWKKLLASCWADAFLVPLSLEVVTGQKPFFACISH